MKFLLLWLEAPLQSWGYNSRFDTRQTFSFPTKSGIYGLLLASSGDSGPQCELLDQMKDAFFLAVSCVPLESDPQKPEEFQLRDYHMVGNGYDKTKKWESFHIPRTPSGSYAVGGGAKQTYRYYLQNKKFAVILGFDDDLAEKFAASLQAPVFDLYLGRKCCVPTDFIFRGVFDSENEARAAMLKLAEDKKLKPGKMLRQVEISPDALLDDAFFLSDVPLEFGPTKRYTDRCVQIVDYE